MDRRRHRERRPTSRSKLRTVRLFVAVYPPPSWVDCALDEWRRLGGTRVSAEQTRLTLPDQIHLTLRFLGAVDLRERDTIEESVERAAATVAPFTLEPNAFDTLPERGPARLVAITAPCPSPLDHLVDQLSRRLPRRGRDGKGFTPHLTILRFRKPDAAFRFSMAHSFEPFSIERIALVESILHPSGAEHRELLSAPLGDST